MVQILDFTNSLCYILLCIIVFFDVSVQHNENYVEYSNKRKVVMRLKWKCLLGALFIILLGINAQAYDNADTYIVDLKSTVSFYSEEHSDRNYHVVTKHELDELIEMDIVE